MFEEINYSTIGISIYFVTLFLYIYWSLLVRVLKTTRTVDVFISKNWFFQVLGAGALWLISLIGDEMVSFYFVTIVNQGYSQVLKAMSNVENELLLLLQGEWPSWLVYFVVMCSCYVKHDNIRTSLFFIRRMSGVIAIDGLFLFAYLHQFDDVSWRRLCR